jgi:hypothetical protein
VYFFIYFQEPLGLIPVVPGAASPDEIQHRVK